MKFRSLGNACLDPKMVGTCSLASTDTGHPRIEVEMAGILSANQGLEKGSLRIELICLSTIGRITGLTEKYQQCTMDSC